MSKTMSTQKLMRKSKHHRRLLMYVARVSLFRSFCVRAPYLCCVAYNYKGHRDLASFHSLVRLQQSKSSSPAYSTLLVIDDSSNSEEPPAPSSTDIPAKPTLPLPPQISDIPPPVLIPPSSSDGERLSPDRPRMSRAVQQLQISPTTRPSSIEGGTHRSPSSSAVSR